MIELYLWIGVLCASWQLYLNLVICKTHKICIETAMKYLFFIILWPGYVFYVFYYLNVWSKIKTDYIPKLKAFIDRKRGKEAADE